MFVLQCQRVTLYRTGFQLANLTSLLQSPPEVPHTGTHAAPPLSQFFSKRSRPRPPTKLLTIGHQNLLQAQTNMAGNGRHAEYAYLSLLRDDLPTFDSSDSDSDASEQGLHHRLDLKSLGGGLHSPLCLAADAADAAGAGGGVLPPVEAEAESSAAGKSKLAPAPAPAPAPTPTPMSTVAERAESAAQADAWVIQPVVGDDPRLPSGRATLSAPPPPPPTEQAGGGFPRRRPSPPAAQRAAAAAVGATGGAGPRPGDAALGPAVRRGVATNRQALMNRGQKPKSLLSMVAAERLEIRPAATTVRGAPYAAAPSCALGTAAGHTATDLAEPPHSGTAFEAEEANATGPSGFGDERSNNKAPTDGPAGERAKPSVLLAPLRTAGSGVLREHTAWVGLFGWARVLGCAPPFPCAQNCRAWHLDPIVAVAPCCSPSCSPATTLVVCGTAAWCSCQAHRHRGIAPAARHTLSRNAPHRARAGSRRSTCLRLAVRTDAAGESRRIRPLPSVAWCVAVPMPGVNARSRPWTMFLTKHACQPDCGMAVLVQPTTTPFLVPGPVSYSCAHVRVRVAFGARNCTCRQVLELPWELVQQALGFLHLFDLYKCRETCKLFRDAADDLLLTARPVLPCLLYCDNHRAAGRTLHCHLWVFLAWRCLRPGVLRRGARH